MVSEGCPWTLAGHLQMLLCFLLLIFSLFFLLSWQKQEAWPPTEGLPMTTHWTDPHETDDRTRADQPSLVWKPVRAKVKQWVVMFCCVLLAIIVITSQREHGLPRRMTDLNSEMHRVGNCCYIMFCEMSHGAFFMINMRIKGNLTETSWTQD